MCCLHWMNWRLGLRDPLHPSELVHQQLLHLLRALLPDQGGTPYCWLLAEGAGGSAFGNRHPLERRQQDQIMTLYSPALVPWQAWRSPSPDQAA